MKIDNVWRHVDADNGIHSVSREDKTGLVIIDGRPFTPKQAHEYALTIFMFASHIEETA